MLRTRSLTRRGHFAEALRLCLCLVAAAAPASGQTATEPALKAAFIFNFAKFTEWPASALPSGSRLALCVISDDQVKAALIQLVKGQAIEGHDVVVPTDDTPATSCHILYIPAEARRRNAPVMTAVKNSPVLTVSDSPIIANDDAIAQLFLDGGKMRFAINVDTAQRSQLRISSRLLSLAKNVRHD